MRIAFVSFECPPDTALGGIGTYVWQAARALAARGHAVEIFSASEASSGRQELEGVTIHRLRHADRDSFRAAVAPVFEARHREARFDVLEGPEFGADAAGAAARVPDVPFVVKLHTPRYLAWRVSAIPMSPLRRMREKLHALRHGIIPGDSQREPSNAVEREGALAADKVISPSLALARVVGRDWGIPVERIGIVPNLFVPDAALTSIAPGGDGHTVTYVGRLQVLKGVMELATAIPRVLRRIPQARFRMVGRSLVSPLHGVPMDAYLRQRLGRHVDAVEFVGGVPPEQVPGLIAGSQLCVFPSRWEAFGYACLEAMAAARAIVGTSDTGLAEVLGHGSAGRLVPPRAPRPLADSIVELLQSPAECLRLGEAARRRVLGEYDAAAVCPLHEEALREAIARRRSLGPRHPMPTLGIAA